MRVLLRRTEPVHSVQFKLRAPTSADGRRLVGGLRVFLGIMLIAEVTFYVPVNSALPSNAPSSSLSQSGDSARTSLPIPTRTPTLSAQLPNYASLAGDQYVVDVHNLHSGEAWAVRLAELIEQSDIFQLFWSSNAMKLPHVRQEWEHASGFIRPVYWQELRPCDPVRGLPPEALGRRRSGV